MRSEIRTCIIQVFKIKELLYVQIIMYFKGMFHLCLKTYSNRELRICYMHIRSSFLIGYKSSSLVISWPTFKISYWNWCDISLFILFCYIHSFVYSLDSIYKWQYRVFVFPGIFSLVFYFLNHGSSIIFTGDWENTK